MEQKLIKYFKDCYLYIKINNVITLTHVYNLFFKKTKVETDDFPDPLLYYYYGIYYTINKNTNNVIKYHTKAIDHGIIRSMYELARHYELNYGLEYEKMKK